MEYKVHLRPSFTSDGWDLFVIQYKQDGQWYLAPNKGILEWTPFKELGIPKPLMHGRDKALLTAIVEGIGDYGVELPSVAEIRGTLKATEVHLKDMRELVFQGKRSDG